MGKFYGRHILYKNFYIKNLRNVCVCVYIYVSVYVSEILKLPTSFPTNTKANLNK